MDPAEPTRSASPFLGPPGAMGDACVRVCARVRAPRCACPVPSMPRQGRHQEGGVSSPDRQLSKRCTDLSGAQPPKLQASLGNEAARKKGRHLEGEGGTG